jgi:hypothetical protein
MASRLVNRSAHRLAHHSAHRSANHLPGRLVNRLAQDRPLAVALKRSMCTRTRLNKLHVSSVCVTMYSSVLCTSGIFFWEQSGQRARHD